MNRFLGILALLFLTCVLVVVVFVAQFHDAGNTTNSVISSVVHAVGLLACTILACVTYILVKYKDK